MPILKVAVCDDIPKELEKISNALALYETAHPAFHFETDGYGASTELINAAEGGKNYDIALLDICMPDIPGTAAARELLAQNPDMDIIFLTTSGEYAVEAFAMNATHYLLKPFTQEQFDAALDRAVQKAEVHDFLSLTCVDGTYRVRAGEIVSVESQSHYLSFSLSSGETLKKRGKLSQVSGEMQGFPGFVRVGASYIVNLAFVRKISSGIMELQGGVRIPVPRRSCEEVQRAYMDFCRREALQ